MYHFHFLLNPKLYLVASFDILWRKNIGDILNLVRTGLIRSNCNKLYLKYICDLFWNLKELFFYKKKNLNELQEIM